MEGGVMQARTYQDVAHFDRNVAMLMERTKAEPVQQ
jgi:hypothetical protein